MGLDDYLCAHSPAELAALPRLALTHPVFKATEAWWKTWRTRGEAGGAGSTAVELLAREERLHQIHPAQDVYDGTLYFALPVAAGALVIVTSDREVLTPDELRARGLELRHTEPGPSSLTRDTALAFRAGAAGSVAGALDAMAAWLARYVVFQDARTPVWLAAWALGTWIYRGFRVFPYLHLRSPEKRCGKTRLMKLLAAVGFNASAATTAPTEAFLYREAARRSGVQAFDEMESLTSSKDAEKFAGLLAVLNAGFERGGAVARQEKVRDTFKTIEFEVFAPRILAGLAPLRETLEDRALPVMMARRRRDEPHERITAETEGEAAGLRDRSALAVLSRAPDILEAVGPATMLLHERRVDDRAVDLWAPLLALGLVGDAETTPAGARAGALLAVAQELSARRDAGDADGTAARLVEALVRVRESQGERVTPSALLAALQGAGWESLRNTRALAGLLAPLGLVSGSLRDGARTFRGYVLGAALLEDLDARYRPAPDPPGAPEEGR